MSRKKKLYSLLAILCSDTLLVTGVICVLILELAKQSTANFESFIIESRQQEISSAVHAFSSDVDTLRLLMLNELEDFSLKIVFQREALEVEVGICLQESLAFDFQT